MMRTFLAAAAALSLSLSALAGEPGRGTGGSTTVGVGLSGETLGDGVSDWSERSVRVRRDFERRKLVEAGVASTRRFGLSDRQVNGTAVWPMGERFTGSVDASYSGTHRILPRHAVGAALQYEFRPAWLVRGGARTTRYAEARVNQASLALEHYFSDYGMTVSWLPTHVFGVTAHSYALQGAWYYGDRDAVSLTLATGREASTIERGIVVLGKVESLGIGGRHVLSPAWSANYGISYTRQAGLYTRKGLSIGLAYTY
ncbi:YaiO family outer membrane beta-barrel protein [Massilia sp. PAMC28688]|uniref:YaiO family outer membrane beta-barrel protein n=1 Tax=Massilia sp. PAMC28688 TaxID=2861283 RepID=UPI001C630CE4|nr:YaiO family outer membrane beta-barrel protein [Massilia sp. PAMC28688]QYF92477.1 YaiO family outer membrane beta-barrel protein [Massilia sp. PAMC28688]